MFGWKSFRLVASVCGRAPVLGPGSSLVLILCDCVSTCDIRVVSIVPCAHASVRLLVSDLWLEPSLWCLVSDRPD